MIRVTEAAANIRKALKAKGWNSRAVSVRTSSYSGGDSITVEVNDAAVDMAAVKAIAKGEEKIDRDQFGDILAGGNRYVSVQVGDGYRAAMAAKYAEPILVAAKQYRDNVAAGRFDAVEVTEIDGAVVEFDGSVMVVKIGVQRPIWLNERAIADAAAHVGAALQGVEL